MEEAEREEEEEGEEEEEESPKELEPEEEEIAIAGVEGLGFLRYWPWEEEGVLAVKKSRFGVRLNSERWKMDQQFHILRGASCRDVASSLVVAVWLMSIDGKMMRRIGFGIIIAKTRGACVIAIN